MTMERQNSIQRALFSEEPIRADVVNANRLATAKDSMQSWCLFIRDCRWSSRQKRALINRYRSVESVFSADAAEVRDTIQSKPRRVGAEVSHSLIAGDLQWLSAP
jgi:hypothetical protein